MASKNHAIQCDFTARRLLKTSPHRTCVTNLAEQFGMPIARSFAGTQASCVNVVVRGGPFGQGDPPAGVGRQAAAQNCV